MKIILKFIRFILVVLAYTSLHACALIQTSPESLNKNIELWLANDEFDEIDDAFQGINKNDTKFKDILDTKHSLIEKRTQFIEHVSITANKYKLSNEWQQALDTYNNALEKITNEPRLIREKASLLLEREEQITTLKKDMLMKRANALISYKKIYEKLHNLIPHDVGAQFDINRYDNDRIEVAGQLEMCGNQARKNKDYDQARDCYSLSNKLEPTKQKSIWVTQINKQLKVESSQKRQSELLGAYKTAFDNHEYNKAQLHLNTLLTINPSHTKAKSLLESLNKQIKELTLNKITLGKELYSKKNINDALSIWKKALQLEPENDELLQLISRAEKVSKKIQSLEKTQ